MEPPRTAQSSPGGSRGRDNGAREPPGVIQNVQKSRPKREPANKSLLKHFFTKILFVFLQNRRAKARQNMLRSDLTSCVSERGTCAFRPTKYSVRGHIAKNAQVRERSEKAVHRRRKSAQNAIREALAKVSISSKDFVPKSTEICLKIGPGCSPEALGSATRTYFAACGPSLGLRAQLSNPKRGLQSAPLSPGAGPGPGTIPRGIPKSPGPSPHIYKQIYYMYTNIYINK